MSMYSSYVEVATERLIDVVIVDPLEYCQGDKLGMEIPSKQDAMSGKLS